MNDNLAEVLEKLEPCPWCGGHAVVDISSGSDERNGYNFSVAIVCVPCSAKLTRASGYDKNGWCNESVASVTARAITAWNTRPALLRDAGDAARYRWLRSDSADLAPLFSAGSGGSMEMHSGDVLDAAIDTAMHAPGGARGF